MTQLINKTNYIPYSIKCLRNLSCKKPISSSDNKTSSISTSQFKELALFGKEYITKNSHILGCEKNESGFLRINIPVTSSAIPTLTKIRLHLWAESAQIQIKPESIHSHPNYFESFIVKGGYEHQLYELDDEVTANHQVWQILKSGAQKTTAYIGEASISSLGIQSVTKGQIGVIDKNVIHRVIKTYVDTMSINAVFREDAKETYFVYLTNKSSLGDIKTERDLLTNAKSKPFIEQMTQYLSTITEAK